jgi:phosphatidylethanolamine/phosphatidyl-N-methylethanolamine N-methyltransferase
VNYLRNNEFYENGFEGLYATGFTGLLKGFVHKIMESPFSNSKFDKILEVGAGSGNHLQYVGTNFKEYYATDIVVDGDLSSNAISGKLFVFAQDAQKLDFESTTFDRVIATCLIAHLDNPIQALSEWRRVAKDLGNITIYIPCEPGLLLRLFRFTFLLPKSLLKGVSDFNSAIVLEHRNSYLLVKHAIKKEFANDKIKLRRYPFPFLSWNFNIFAVVNIRVTKG